MRVVEERSIFKIALLIAVIQKLGHSCFDIEDHLAEHAIGPAKPTIAVS